MSKSILIIDTPECCDYCPLGRIFGMAGAVECKTGNEIAVNWNGAIIPDWCPLKEMPKKIDENNTHIYREYYRAHGYNACIDEILRECDENEVD